MHFYSSVVAAATAVCLLTAGDASAHMGKGVPHHLKIRQVIEAGSGAMTPVVKRAPSPSPVRPTDEVSAAKSTVAAHECKPYSVPEVVAISKQFPTVWETANILPSDQQAQQIWQTIQNSGIIPSDVKQKGSGGKGDFTAVTPSYPSSDPDCWFETDKCTKPKHAGLNEDVWQCPEPDTWGLTFDDGPNCSHNAFYDFLRDQKQKATLYYIGSNVLDWPLEAQRGLVDGHHICVHTWSHQYMTQLSNDVVFAELYYTAKAIKNIVGVTPRCWRPPYGDVDDRVRAIAQGLGLSTQVWSDDTEDWQVKPQGALPTASVSANYMSIINQNYNTHGNIVLTHEINGDTMDLMLEMYPIIKQHFKNIVPVTACMNETNPYPEAITYPNFADYVSGNIEPSGLPQGADIKVQPDATYDPLAAAAQAKAAGDTTGGSTSSNAKQASAQGKSSSAIMLTVKGNPTAVVSGLVAAVVFALAA